MAHSIEDTVELIVVLDLQFLVMAAALIRCPFFEHFR